MTWEDIYMKYKLSDDEQKHIGEYINKKFLEGKTPVEHPIAIIDIGPTGSGKTALNGYALKQFKDDNLVIVNNDELKTFHPKADEVAKLYPDCYVKVINEASKQWTDNLVDKVIEGKYNILYEGTGRKIKIFENMISKMRKQGYRIIVRAMAVNELNCLMSMVERYEGQVQEKGWGRNVSVETFYKGYSNEMLDTIDIFEKTGLVDIVEVYMRGKIPSNPIRIYSSQNGEFKDARTAVIVGREKDRKQAEQYYEQNFSKRTSTLTDISEEKEILERINYLGSNKIKDNITIKEITEKIEKSSTDFEKSNTELKRKYLVWNIEVFNIIASLVSVSKGSFGTGYPFYALDENLNGTLPIISEQIRYNRQLVVDGKIVQQSRYRCKSCIDKLYSIMPDLKRFCKPCPNMLDNLKPRKLINRLPDIDMWLVCEDGCTEQAEIELTDLLEKYNMNTSDNDPFSSIEDISKISQMIKEGKMPTIFLPMDVHIIEYSTIKQLITQMPQVLKESESTGIQPYLPIHPKSYRKSWQYDDEAYNYAFDYLATFTHFNFPEELKQIINESYKKIATDYTPEQLFDFLMASATESTVRRFCEPKLEEIFKNKVQKWSNSTQEITKNNNDISITSTLDNPDDPDTDR